MDIAIGHALFQAFRRDRFLFGYSAVFHDAHTERLLQLSDAIAEEVMGERIQRRKLAFLLIEAYQNIIRHRAELPPHLTQGEGRSLFLFRADPEGQHLVATNGVQRRNVPEMERQLDAIATLDHAELRELSMRMLQEASAETRGAGVGLIEMARRSGNDLGHLIQGMGPEHCLFTLVVRLGRAHPFERIIREAMALHGTVVMNDILLFQVGVMPAGVRQAMAEIVREDSDHTSEHARMREGMYRAAIKAMDQGGRVGRGVCVLAREGDRYALVQGVVLPTEEARARERELEAIARRDRQALEAALRMQRMAGGDGARGRVGMLELAVNAHGPLIHRSFPVDGGELVLVKVVF